MVNGAFTSYSIEDRSFVSYVKREIHNLVKEYFTEQRTGEIDIVISELTSNIIKHAGRGELLYRLTTNEEKRSFEVLAIDSGPGIKDIGAMMKDGTSTSNTLGQGLGAISRLCSFYQIYSRSSFGTIVYCKISPEAYDDDQFGEKHFHADALSVCKPGETFCGDGYSIVKSPTRLNIFLGDGLGHGPHAHEASQTAVQSFVRHNGRQLSPPDLLRTIHVDVKKTRGLVGSVALINTNEKLIRLCGVGNITTRIYNGIILKNYMSYNGILGMNVPNTMNVQEHPMERYQTIIMFSDGIKNRWDIASYPNLLKCHPLLIAAVIYKDQARGTDDMSVLVARIK
jgi:anti-sigma regulatory factor (Ser/Thr protein kinase)